MWATFRSYASLKAGKEDSTDAGLSSTFTPHDRDNLRKSSTSISGQSARRKLMLAVTEDTDCFRELQRQLRESRPWTNLAIKSLLMEDVKLLDSIANKVVERNVNVPLEKQLKGTRDERMSMGMGVSTNQLFHTLKCLVPRNSISPCIQSEPSYTESTFRMRSSLPVVHQHQVMDTRTSLQRTSASKSNLFFCSTNIVQAALSALQLHYDSSEPSCNKRPPSSAHLNFSSKKLAENLQLILDKERNGVKHGDSLNTIIASTCDSLEKFMANNDQIILEKDLLVGFPPRKLLRSRAA